MAGGFEHLGIGNDQAAVWLRKSESLGAWAKRLAHEAVPHGHSPELRRDGMERLDGPHRTQQLMAVTYFVEETRRRPMRDLMEMPLLCLVAQCWTAV